MYYLICLCIITYGYRGFIEINSYLIESSDPCSHGNSARRQSDVHQYDHNAVVSARNRHFATCM